MPVAMGVTVFILQTGVPTATTTLTSIVVLTAMPMPTPTTPAMAMMMTKAIIVLRIIAIVMATTKRVSTASRNAPISAIHVTFPTRSALAPWLVRERIQTMNAAPVTCATETVPVARLRQMNPIRRTVAKTGPTPMLAVKTDYVTAQVSALTNW
jgi:hypothetical protein